MPKIGIGPNFFRNELRVYNNWLFAWPREVLQNGVDAGSTKIDVTITDQRDAVLVTVENNGEPMTEDVLVNKLLTLGESGKAGLNGVVGAFGQAKVLLYYSMVSYTIVSGDNQVNGCGGEYDLTKIDKPFHGTRSVVSMNLDGKCSTDIAAELVRQFKRVIVMTQRPSMTFTVNGEVIPANLKKGSRRRSFSWGTAYTNKTFENRLIVRIGGLPMLTKWISAPRTVILELDRPSQEILTSNRDSLQYKYADQLDDFMYDLAVNKRSALEEPTVSYTHYKGSKLEATKESDQTVTEVLAAAYATIQTVEDRDVNEDENGPTLAIDSRPVLEVVKPEAATEEIDYDYTADKKRLPRLGFDFLIRNELGMVVPEHILPESFSAYSRKLVKSWAACLLEIHKLFNNTDDFSVGFVLSDESEALHEKGHYGTVLFINPCVVKRNSFGGRSLARRWNFTPAGKMAILAAALHEFCHRYHSSHDECYASFLTECSGVVFRHIGKFHRCFR